MSQQPFWADSFRPYLHLLGLSQLDKEIVDRVDLSGVVQTTMLEAFQQGSMESKEMDEDYRRAWLRRLFLNNLLDEVRKLKTRKRDVRSEVPLERSIGNSASRVQAYLASTESSPSIKAIRSERAESLLEALSHLPDAQREAIRLYHLQEVSVEEIAKRMNRPKGAIAALIYRGMLSLRSTSTLLE